jgi:S-formylglutathione hydrolase
MSVFVPGNSGVKVIKEWKSFGGTLYRLSHTSSSTQTPMQFSVFIPPAATKTPQEKTVPAIFYLSGLTCTDENVIQKGCFLGPCAELGFAFIAPDTSPRGAGIEGEEESWDFGTGAGFYLDAQQAEWRKNYRMYSYISDELPKLLVTIFPVISPGPAAITGHSMGGHGALTIALKNPLKFRAVSAFAPICHPMNCPWGKKAFTNYLGKDGWEEYDACELMKTRGPLKNDILIDQGTADSFFTDGQLQPEAFKEACAAVGQSAQIRMQEGYDHSYFFISSFAEEHVRFLARTLTSRTED